MCCYEEDESLPFKCYHYFTPAYHYRVDEDGIEKLPNPDQPASSIVQMKMSPKYGQNTQTKLRATLKWKSEEHLTLDIYDPEKFSPEESPLGRAEDGDHLRSEDEPWADDLESLGHFHVSYSKASEYFFVSIQRNGTSETLFDTRLGPLISEKNLISFATALPTKWFYGLKGMWKDELNRLAF